MLMKRFYDFNAPKDKWKTYEEGCTKCNMRGVVLHDIMTEVVTCPDCNGLGRVERNTPPLDYIRIIHTGVKPEQNFSTRFVERGLSEGWLVLKELTLELHFKPSVLTYEILEKPGRYCCFCMNKLIDDDTGSAARIHVLQHHKDQVSPGRHGLVAFSGYYKNNCYRCRLESVSHLRWAIPEYAKVSHVRWKDSFTTINKG